MARKAKTLQPLSGIALAEVTGLPESLLEAEPFATARREIEAAMRPAKDGGLLADARRLAYEWAQGQLRAHTGAVCASNGELALEEAG